MTRLALALILALVSAPLGAAVVEASNSRDATELQIGTPNLTAPAPRMADGKPDLSESGGLIPVPTTAMSWRIGSLRISPAWADALYKQRMEDLGKDDPATFQCLPAGPRALIGGLGWARVIQTPWFDRHPLRRPRLPPDFLDGRSCPKDPHPSFMGYSVGRWEGDTLVVDSIGFKDRPWLDVGGHPHSEALEITERFGRRDFGHIDLQETFHDPQGVRAPVDHRRPRGSRDRHRDARIRVRREREGLSAPGWQASDEKKNAVKVAPEMLAKYVGAYEFRAPEDPTFVMILNVTHSGEELSIDVAGKDKQAMISLSDTLFAAVGGRVEFIVDDRGAATEIVFHAVEGPMKAKRKPDTSGAQK